MSIDLTKKFEVVRAAERLNSRKTGYLEFFVWTLGILILTSLLVLDFLPLLFEYRHNNVETDILVISSGKSNRPPNLTICLPYHSKALSNIAKYLIEFEKGGKFENANECQECEA